MDASVAVASCFTDLPAALMTLLAAKKSVRSALARNRSATVVGSHWAAAVTVARSAGTVMLERLVGAPPRSRAGLPAASVNPAARSAGATP